VNLVIFAEKPVAVLRPPLLCRLVNKELYGAEVSMDRIRIGYPAGYLQFFGSGLDLDNHF